MFEKMSIRPILRDHLATLHSYDSDRVSYSDIFVYFIIPFAVAAVLTYFRPVLADALVSVLATSLSIFAALLFNLILLIYDLTNRQSDGMGDWQLRQKLLIEIYSNVSFCILTAVWTLIILLIDYLGLSQHKYFLGLLAFLVYWLVIIFLFTLFIVLKRIHILLRREVKEPETR